MSDSANVDANVDERVKEMSSFRKSLIRPELGGICGTVAVFVFFALFAFDSGMFNSQGILNWSIVSAQFMIIAVGACLLMIAGEFDLSVGSMIGFAGMMIAIFSVTLGVASLALYSHCLCHVRGDRRAQRHYRRANRTAQFHRDPGVVVYSPRIYHLSAADRRTQNHYWWCP